MSGDPKKLVWLDKMFSAPGAEWSADFDRFDGLLDVAAKAKLGYDKMLMLKLEPSPSQHRIVLRIPQAFVALFPDYKPTTPPPADPSLVLLIGNQLEVARLYGEEQT